MKNEDTKSGDVNVIDLFRLNGKTAYVVGGSQGLGASMALGLAQAGARVAIGSRNEETCARVAREIGAATGGACLSIPIDVSSESSVQSAFARVADELGGLDILINSAGINIRAPIDDCSLETFESVTDTNLKGTWLCCREAARMMKPRRSGSIINLGSALSSVALPERTPYCSSKFGVIGLTQALALELAPHNVRCNAICPGAFLTEINKPLLKEPEKVKMLVGLMALNRWGELHEIRGAALFLASDASTFVTGSSLYVDAGWTAK
ncbi:MAG: SDR family oxidoreductase [Opitutaceae bacterium]